MCIQNHSLCPNWENISYGNIPHYLFEGIEDHRMDRRKLHSLKDILAISLCATISGAEGWEDMENFGKSKEYWLRTWLELPNGIPSDDTFRRVISTIKPQEFNQVLVKLGNWVKERLLPDNDNLNEEIDNQRDKEQIAIDGKCLRSATDKDHKRGAFYMVNAWSTNKSLALGQLKVNGKSNEITAIPEILKLISVKDCVISIDAAGTQKNIANDIKNANGDYILALKGNQESLHDEVWNFFKQAIAIYDNSQKLNEKGSTEMEAIGVGIYTTQEEGHGRVEKREVFATGNLTWLPMKEAWKGLQSIIAVRSTRMHHGKVSVETRHYISSLFSDPQKIGKCIRRHWSIENSLHWVLDVAFKEDEIGISNGYAAENLAILRTLSLSLLKRNKKSGGIKAKRKRAGWDTNFLMEALLSNYF